MGLSRNSTIFIATVLLVSIALFVGAQDPRAPNEWALPDDAVFHTADAVEQGPGSGLDADYVDGIDSSVFVLGSGSGSDGEPASLLALGMIIADESESVMTYEGGGGFEVSNKFDDNHDNQVAYVVPVSMPTELPEGKSLRLIVDVSQLDDFNSNNNDFCYTPVYHGWDGGKDKKSCTRRWYEKGSWKTESKTPEDYFWIETSSDSGSELEPRGCTVIYKDGTEDENPYVEKNAGLVCYIDLDEPVYSVAVHTADWDDGNGNWEFKIYYKYMGY